MKYSADSQPNPMLRQAKIRKLVLGGLWTAELAVWLASAGCSVDLDNLRQNHGDASVPVADSGGDVGVADTGRTKDDALTSDAVPTTDLSERADARADIPAAPDAALITDVDEQPDGRGQPADGSEAVNDAVSPGDFGNPDAALDDGPSQDNAAAVDEAVSAPDAGFPEIPDVNPMAPDAVPDSEPPPTVANLSQGKPVTASAQAAGNEAIFGNDGASATSFCGAAGTFPVWWRVDLVATFNAVRADVSFASPTSIYQYKIETSTDDSTYTTVVDQSANTTRSGAPLSDAFTVQARYVRITILGVSPPLAQSAGACFSEFSVWGYAPPGSAAATLANLAPSGTAYRWYNNTSPTADTNKVAAPMLNNNSVAADLNLAGTGYDPSFDAYEAAGVIFGRASTISSVVFVEGASDASTFGDPDGNFTANFHLEFSTDGSMWTDAAGWNLAPTYPYDSTAANRDYVFSGSATGILGVRVTGQVHPDFLRSSYSRAREVQVWGQE